VLLFNGTGTSSSDVSAIEAVLATLGVAYTTADSTQLNAVSERQLGGYKLIIVPGGNSITIGENLSGDATSMIRGAVQMYGVHYLGVCAGAFFGAHSRHATGKDPELVKEDEIPQQREFTTSPTRQEVIAADANHSGRPLAARSRTTD